MWIDSAPIRFLIAETETGYTLLAALWLARRLGAEKAIELSPLFETAEALDRGERVLEEALRSPHYRDYLRAHGRICLQFGYSDSGRYVGQLAGSYLAERLKLRLVELLRRHKLDGIEVVLFDTHGESVGRGGHPDSLADRFAYLSPPQARMALDRAGLKLREETAFQGGDGYLLFGTPALAQATIAGIAKHAFAPAREVHDPVYAEADYVADFFATVRREMQALVADPGYAALLGAFGPGLLDRTGSRPAVRQADGMGGPVRISHPGQLRAIPNNAILQQLGWMANSLHGLGAAATANPDAFNELRAKSPRFARALAMAARASACSDIGVLRAVVDTLDPGPWLDRAGFTRRPGRREELLGVAAAVEGLDLDAPVRKLFRRLQADHLALRHAWPDLPVMQDRLVLLHALRLALIHRIWLLAVVSGHGGAGSGLFRYRRATCSGGYAGPGALAGPRRLHPPARAAGGIARRGHGGGRARPRCAGAEAVPPLAGGSSGAAPCLAGPAGDAGPAGTAACAAAGADPSDLAAGGHAAGILAAAWGDAGVARLAHPATGCGAGAEAVGGSLSGGARCGRRARLRGAGAAARGAQLCGGTCGDLRADGDAVRAGAGLRGGDHP